MAIVSNVHVNLSRLKVKERLTASILVLVRGIDVLKVANCLFKQLAHSAETHRYNIRHGNRGLFTFPRSRTKAGEKDSIK